MGVSKLGLVIQKRARLILWSGKYILSNISKGTAFLLQVIFEPVSFKHTLKNKYIFRTVKSAVLFFRLFVLQLVADYILYYKIHYFSCRGDPF